MADNERKPALQHVPAILTGTAALIAALTGVYVNLHDTRGASAPKAEARPAAPIASATANTAPVPLRVQVERIAVEHDGRLGTTDWRFTVAADGEPLFAFAQDALDDSGGRNVVVPKDAQGLLRLAPGKRVHLTVQGWRGGLFGFGAKPIASGEGTLAAAGALAPIRVQAAQPEDGAFVFHLSAEPVRGQ
ncbi:MAG: hypothetical protein HOQ02_12910 [Lysobacter sp.]|nr:hypothetical protein [Lysobacter sp.]